MFYEKVLNWFCSLSICIQIILTALAALVLANFLPNIEIRSFESALVLAIVLGFLNTFLKPILILLTLQTVLSLDFSIDFKCNNCFYNSIFCKWFYSF